MNKPFSPVDLLPDPTNSALLVVDVQEKLVSAMPERVISAVLRNTCILIQTAREFSLPILVSEQYPKGLGPTVAGVRTVFPEDLLPVEKVTFSCCRAPAFQPLLKGLGPRAVILCGIEAHVCVLQTALDLLHQGRQVFVAADAVCSRSKHNWRASLDLMRQAGAIIGTTEIFTFGLLKSAGSGPFKQISNLVK
jgi:nicotinamidase-related amidase